MENHRSRLALKIILAVNIALVAAYAVGWLYVLMDATVAANAKVTELDRHGAINEDALRQWNPDLAENVRAELARILAKLGDEDGMRYSMNRVRSWLSTRSRKYDDEFILSPEGAEFHPAQPEGLGEGMTGFKP